LGARSREQLVRVWEGLLASRLIGVAIIEDPARPHPASIEAFGASVFVTDAFAEEFRANPHPYLAAVIYEPVNVILRTFRLSKRFGRTLGLDRLTFDVSEGSVYGLIGPNGAGKTTAVKTLMNIVDPTISYSPFPAELRIGPVEDAWAKAL
jgi:ABC-type multidrug transport system fused ATPase/permease subunit